jgi:hypothetical protein
MLELWSNIQDLTIVSASPAKQLPVSLSNSVPPTLEENNHASRMVAMWETRSKEQGD